MANTPTFDLQDKPMDHIWDIGRMSSHASTAAMGVSYLRTEEKLFFE